jgi:uncharacterized protein (TIGR02145 family)
MKMRNLIFNILCRRNVPVIQYPLLDKNGNEYTTVIIGSQEWIVENYRTTKYSDGSYIPNITNVLALNAIDGAEWVDGTISWDLITINGVNISASSNGSVLCFATLGTLVTSDSSKVKFTYNLTINSGSSPRIVFLDNNGAVRYDELLLPGSNTIYFDEYYTVDTYIIYLVNGDFDPGFGNFFATDFELTGFTVEYIGWGTDIEGAYCAYDNDTDNIPVYGLLYNFPAIDNIKGLAYLERNGVQEDGWRIFTHTDLLYLIATLGGASVAASKLKETGTVHWNSPNSGATNESGFTALAGGYRNDDGLFYNKGITFYMYSSTEQEPNSIYNLYIEVNDDEAYILSESENMGLSVRLVRDVNSLGSEMVNQSLWCAVNLSAYWNYVGANWSGDGSKLISAGEPGLPLQKINFWQIGKTYRVVVEVDYISGWFEIFDGLTYTFYITSSGIFTYDITPGTTGLYLDSSSFYGDILFLSIKEIL